MTKQKDGGLAFPTRHGTSGMTLRQWYAGQIISGWLSANITEAEWAGQSIIEDAAKMAFEAADALIAEGEKDDS